VFSQRRVLILNENGNWSNNNRGKEVVGMTVASQVKKTLATLKGNQGTLRLYAMQTSDEETRLLYNEALDAMEIIADDLEKRLQTIEYQEPQYKGN
jgi:bacterioferritin (cytochrome b1)